MNTELTTAVLRRALAIKEQIEQLQAELSSVLTGTTATAKTASRGRRKKRKMSPEARAKIAAAQKARWVRFRREKAGK